ncbi:MarR family transcriptional regulator [bacterium]|nr:MarR family transcriptional regulator [bacterium]
MKASDLGSPIELFTRRMFTQIIRKLSAYLAQGNFSISEVAALHIIGQSEGVSVQNLATELNLSISATSRLITGLVKKGLILRRKDSKDSRARIITCSKKGCTLLDEMSLERVSAIFELIPTLPGNMATQIMTAVSQYKKES